MKNKNLKNFFTLLLISLLILNIFPNKLCSMDFNNFDFDTINIDLNLLENFENFTTKAQEDLYEKLIPVILNINTPLWNKTKTPKGRDTLYLIPHRISSLEYGGFILNSFFNYTNKIGFSLNEALKLDENKESLEAFTKVLIEELDSEEASSLIPLFKKLIIQERKIGGLFQLGFTTGPFRVEIDSSLQLSERNFWLNKNDQIRIKRMFSDIGSTFDNKELYKINFGMGDTRLKLGLNSLNMNNFQIDIGLEGIFPTSKISIDDRLKEYKVDYDNLEKDIPNILRSIRDNLITPQLGNNGHYGLGCYIETKIDLLHNSIHLWNRASFDNLFLAKENRLIPSKKTKEPLEIDWDNTEQVTNFIKEFIFPPSYKVKVQPGDVINFISTLSFKIGKQYNCALGYDYYHQEEELFESIYTSEDIYSLRIEDAKSQSASQHKIFAETNYTKKQNGYNFIWGAGGDYTISSNNLGHDWTLFLRCGIAF